MLSIFYYSILLLIVPPTKKPPCNYSSCRATWLIQSVFSSLTSVFPESGSSNKDACGSGSH